VFIRQGKLFEDCGILPNRITVFGKDFLADIEKLPPLLYNTEELLTSWVDFTTVVFKDIHFLAIC
jgi:hypothetical protein